MFTYLPMKLLIDKDNLSVRDFNSFESITSCSGQQSLKATYSKSSSGTNSNRYFITNISFSRSNNMWV
jgi:hypothetical protein